MQRWEGGSSSICLHGVWGGVRKQRWQGELGTQTNRQKEWRESPSGCWRYCRGKTGRTGNHQRNCSIHTPGLGQTSRTPLEAGSKCFLTVIGVGLKEPQAWSISSRDLLNFFAHKPLSDGLWQLVQVKDQTHFRIRLKFTWQQMAIRLHTDRRESLPAVYWPFFILSTNWGYQGTVRNSTESGGWSSVIFCRVSPKSSRLCITPDNI